jgi:hypothetical protein
MQNARKTGTWDQRSGNSKGLVFEYFLDYATTEGYSVQCEAGKFVDSQVPKSGLEGAVEVHWLPGLRSETSATRPTVSQDACLQFSTPCKLLIIVMLIDASQFHTDCVHVKTFRCSS